MIPRPVSVSPETNARRFRALLQFYIVRHIIGVAVFVWLAVKAKTEDGGPFWLVLGGLGLVYAGVTIFNGFRLAAQYKRSVQRAEMAGK